ncbi:hypothetical protein BRAS3843_520224 [Bradyrhizobium sp. STM 3843]|nr:hypothetical protein BRAS3843_520224 [Bradyrhizobium sp. STM 3843]
MAADLSLWPLRVLGLSQHSQSSLFYSAWWENGAPDTIRTRDLHLGRATHHAGSTTSYGYLK